MAENIKSVIIVLKMYWHTSDTTSTSSHFSMRGHKLMIVIAGYILAATRPRGHKTFFMLNSVEHDFLNAHKDKNIKKFGFN